MDIELGKMVMNCCPAVRKERFGAMAIPQKYSLLNREQRSYLEFPNQMIDW